MLVWARNVASACCCANQDSKPSVYSPSSNNAYIEETDVGLPNTHISVERSSIHLYDIVPRSSPYDTVVSSSPSPGVVVGRKYTCNQDCTADYDQCITCRNGEVLKVLEEPQDKFWVYVSTGDGREGYVEVACLQQRCEPTGDSESHYVQPFNHKWFFPNITRAECEETLKQIPFTPGKFLVRYTHDKSVQLNPNQTTSHVIVLSVLLESHTVKHIMFPSTDSLYFQQIGKGRFRDLPSYIEYYQEHSHESFGKLVCATKKSKPAFQRPTALESVDIDHSSLEVKERIGVGNFGEVYKGRIINYNFDVAIKMAKSGVVDANELLKEAVAMEKLKHINVVRLVAVVTKEPVYIVTELMSNGSLSQYLRKNAGKALEFGLQAHFAFHIASGMSYLEKENFIHRDLRADNVLLGENLVCKIGDFGLARCLDDLVYNTGAETFPVRWSAPEIFSSLLYSTFSDVWSYGIVLYEIVTKGATPYSEMANADIEQFVVSEKILSKPTICNELFYNRMKMCWKFKPHDRPSFYNTMIYFRTLASYEDIEI